MVKLFTPEGGSVLYPDAGRSLRDFLDNGRGPGTRERVFGKTRIPWSTTASGSVDWADFEEKLQQADLLPALLPPQSPGHRLGGGGIAPDDGAVPEAPCPGDVRRDPLRPHFHGKKHIPTATLSPEIAANVVTGISGTKTFNLAGLQASTVVFPDAHKKQVFDHYWQCMDIHRNNAFSLTAMETAFNEGEEWLEQLLPYLSANFDYVVDYCRTRIPQIKTFAPHATYLMWLDCRELGLSNQELHDFMIQKAKLGLNDGCSFDRQLSGFMRLNAACPRATLEQAMAPAGSCRQGAVTAHFINKRPVPFSGTGAFFTGSNQKTGRQPPDFSTGSTGSCVKKTGAGNSRPCF
mgnify:CR=1 FL=1